MPFDDDTQRKWVAVLTGGRAGLAPGTQPDLETALRIKQQEEMRGDLELKATLLTQAREVVEQGKEDMRAAFAFDIEVKGKKVPLLGPNGDATKGFDTEETKDVTQPPTGKQMDAAYRAMDILVGQKDFLLKQKTKYSTLDSNTIVTEEKALFTETEVMRELYTPLVRELVVPDTVISDQFSQTQKMLDASNDAYLKELEGYAEPDPMLDGLGKAKEIFDFAAKITTAATTGIDVAQTVLSLATKIVDAGLDASTALIGKADPTKAVPAFGNNVAGVIGGILGAATGDKNLGTTATQVMKGAVSGSSAVAALLKQPQPDFDGFFNNLITSIETGAGQVATTVEKSGGDDKEAAERKAVIIKGVGSGLASLARAAITSKKKALIEDIKKGNWGAVTATISGALVSLGSTANEITGEAQGIGKSKEQVKEISERGEKIEAHLKLAESGVELDESVLEKLKSEREALEKKAAEWLKADKDPGPDKPGPEDEKRILSQLKAEADEQARMLDKLTATGGGDPDVKSIAALIEQMKRDRAIMSAVASVGSAGVAVVEKFLAGFPGTALASFLTNVASAVQRATHLRKWLEAHDDAESAVSPYKTAIENFVKNQAEQFAQATIQAAINVLQIGAGIASMAVPLAAPIATGLSLAASGQELMYKYYKEQALKSAWKTTREALDNPKNRKLGLIARRMNPTLAKYTLAYGAIEEKDVVAITAMNRCGLTRETLAAKDANVSRVKSYLVTLYPDDGEVKGEYDDGDWRKTLPEPRLDVVNWSLAWETAKKNGGPQEANPRGVVAALKQVAKLEAALRGKPEERDYEALETALEALGSAMSAVTAKDAKVATLFGSYRDVVAARLAEVREQRAVAFPL